MDREGFEREREAAAVRLQHGFLRNPVSKEGAHGIGRFDNGDSLASMEEALCNTSDIEVVALAFEVDAHVDVLGNCNQRGIACMRQVESNPRRRSVRYERRLAMRRRDEPQLARRDAAIARENLSQDAMRDDMAVAIVRSDEASSALALINREIVMPCFDFVGIRVKRACPQIDMELTSALRVDRVARRDTSERKLVHARTLCMGRATR